MAFYEIGGNVSKNSDAGNRGPLPSTKTEVDYKTRVEMIRKPQMNHMSRTRAKVERFNKNSGTTPTGKRKKKAYDGAYVAEVRRQIHSGFMVAGSFLQHLHAFVIDMDLTSLYPTIMMILNLSPKTFVAKIFFAKKMEIPKYEYIQFIDKEERLDYKCNANDFAMEALQGRHWWALGELFCNLPSTTEILDHIQDNIGNFR